MMYLQDTKQEISIHAPTRGATKGGEQDESFVMDFNPRSYKRSDRSRMQSTVRQKNFNPRSYKRSDTYIANRGSSHIISIHAPTRGATAKMHNIPYASLQ